MYVELKDNTAGDLRGAASFAFGSSAKLSNMRGFHGSASMVFSSHIARPNALLGFKGSASFTFGSTAKLVKGFYGRTSFSFGSSAKLTVQLGPRWARVDTNDGTWDHLYGLGG